MKLWTPVLTAAALLASGSALADSKTAGTGSFKTSIEILKTCTGVTISTGTPDDPQGADIDFGKYEANHKEDIDGASKATLGGISITCSNGTAFTVTLSPISNSQGQDGSGRMKHTNPTHETYTISYQLFQDGGRQQKWGAGVNAYTGTGKGLDAGATVLPVYGKVAGGQLDKPVGRYSDTVNVTVTY